MNRSAVTYRLYGLRMRAEFRTRTEAVRAAADLRINRRIRDIRVHELELDSEEEVAEGARDLSWRHPEARGPRG